MVIALGEADMTVPFRSLAVHPEREAILAERISGATWFYRIKDPDEQVRVARDFIRSVWPPSTGSIPGSSHLPSFGPVRERLADHVLERIEEIPRLRGHGTRWID